MKQNIVTALFLAVFLAVSLFFAPGCSLIGVNTGPITPQEAFPDFTPDPHKVLAIFEGEASFAATLYDEATGQPVGVWFESGALPYLSYNGQPPARITTVALAYGQYKIVIKPFYYVSYFLPFIRYRVDLPEQWMYISLHPGKQPVYETIYTKRYWADVVRINSGRIPQEHFQAPTVDVQGTGIMRDIIESSRRRYAR